VCVPPGTRKDLLEGTASENSFSLGVEKLNRMGSDDTLVTFTV